MAKVAESTSSLLSFFSPRGIHHYILDNIEARISRAAAIRFNNMGAIFSSILFSGKIFNYAILIQPPIFALIEFPIIFLSLIVTFRYFTDTYREDIEQIIQNSNDKENDKEKNILIIEAADWTAGQISDHQIIKTLVGDSRLCAFRFDLQKLRKTCAIKRLFAHSEKQLNDDLKNLKDKTIDILWIRGHGNSEKIHFNNSFSLDRDSKDLMQIIAKKIKNKAAITLEACTTGKGYKNIAKTLSNYCLNAIIRAPQDVIGPSTFYTDDLFPFYFDLNGQKVQTCLFRNGESLSF